MYVRAIYIPLSSCEISSRVLDPPVLRGRRGRFSSSSPVNVTSSPRRRHRRLSFALNRPSLPKTLNLESTPWARRNPRVVQAVYRDSASFSHQADVLANCLCFYHVGIFLRPTSGWSAYTRAIGTTVAGLEGELVTRRFFLVCRLSALCKTSRCVAARNACSSHEA